MKITLKRRFKGESYTIGALYIDGVYLCETLEDKDRGLRHDMPIEDIIRQKVKGETAIPTGTYKVVTDIVSPKYSTREAYRFCGGKVPRLLNVPGYEGILMHIGNTQADTQGCILVGENKVKGQVINSTATFKRLYERLKNAEDITIEIS
jgi:hypothetical protein